MCDPVTAIAAASFALNAGGAIVRHGAAANRAEAEEAAARQSFREAQTDIALLEASEKRAAKASIFDLERQARAAEAIATVSAGESSVAGDSVREVVGDIKAGAHEAVFRTEENLETTLLQLSRERISGRTIMQNRLAGIQRPSALGTGLQLGGAALDSALFIRGAGLNEQEAADAS